MAPGYHDQEGVPENLRKQLAVAIRTIQWSYAIFWSISSRQPGVLEWGDGYYNGDIKTRKTVQAVEFRADQLGLQRSEQLRELYVSLSEGESSPHARRPSAALSPEDLTDAEWYYLVCMSFVFNIGQSLPGRTLANGQPIWLCNSHCADTKVFNRSLLAKSASIQTVVCFPFLGGVIELGTTELVPKDLSLIQRVKTSFLDIPSPIVSIISRSVSRTEEDLAYANLGRESFDADFNPIVGCEVEVCSPNNSSNGIGLNQQAEECFMTEGLQEGVSQEQSPQFMDDEVANHVHNSITTCDSISQTLFNPEKVIQENEDCLLGIQEDNQMKLTSLGLKADEIHYETVLSTLLKSSHQQILGPHVRDRNQESCFISWKKGGFMGIQMPQSDTPQRLLKRVLIEVAQMHGDCFLDSREDNGRTDKLWKPKVDDIDSNHVLAERRRREKINERFLVLGSLVPSTCKVDKVSILDNTIEHVKVLKKRVEELESSGEVAKPEARTRRKNRDTVERTFDNYGNDYVGNGKKALINKRKACDIDKIEPEITRALLKDSYLTDKVTVSVVEKDVLIEIRCPWRESLLLEIMGTMSHLHLDSHSLQSTNTDGILSLTIKSKFNGSTFASVGIIRQAIQRVIQKC